MFSKFSYAMYFKKPYINIETKSWGLMNHRIIKRYFLSFFWYTVLFLKNRYTGKSNYFLKLENVSYSEVHISCPGPSAKLIESYKFTEGTPVVFVNHAVGLLDSPVFLNTRNFFFSADGVRVAEVISLKLQCLKKCTSVLVPGHLFQVSWKIIESIDYIARPRCHFSMNYGLVIQGCDTNDIQALSDKAISYGFGSLLMAISFALLFRPKVIHIWGADLKSVNGVTYFSKEVPRLEQLPFDLMKSTISIATKVLKVKGIEIKMHTGNQDV
jgi:hypothetical protein